MTTVQHSIEVKVPVHTAYDRLSHFEEYPRFMEDVETVRRIDDTHLQWVTRMDNRPVEWDAEITEQEPDRCIAWHNTSGPANGGRLELQPLGDERARITFTWNLEPAQVPGTKAGDPKKLMTQRLEQDLARMKDFIEVAGARTQGQSPSASGSVPMRHIGEMPQDTSGARHGGTPSSDAKGRSELASNPQPSPPPLGQASAAPERPAHVPPGTGTAAVVGALGGTDAAAGARLSGSKGGPGGPSPRELSDAEGVPGSPGGMVQGDAVSPAAGATAAGGTGLSSAATADDTRTGTGTSAGTATGLTGGGLSGTHGPGINTSKGSK